MDDRTGLDDATVDRFLAVGRANIDREYPNHPGHLLLGPHDLRAPRTLHPVFFGSYDWHSSVHQHWMLVRLLRCRPGRPEEAAVRRHLTERITPAAVAGECAYFAAPQRRSFERPYGWVWLLALGAELRAWTDPDARRWARHLAPLAGLLRRRSLEWLASTSHPQRSGTHPNSAFALAMLLDVARATSDRELTDAATDTARRWYTADAGYPAWAEPSATDFLSPALVEADLMTRLLGRDAFADWFDAFLPDSTNLEQPATVDDRSDPQYVHLDGLHLSRAWCWQRIARHLPDDHPRRPAAAGLSRACGGDYVGEHWLPTFAVYLLTAER